MMVVVRVSALQAVSPQGRYGIVPRLFPVLAEARVGRSPTPRGAHPPPGAVFRALAENRRGTTACGVYPEPCGRSAGVPPAHDVLRPGAVGEPEVFATPFSGPRQHPAKRTLTECGRPERAGRPRSYSTVRVLTTPVPVRVRDARAHPATPEGGCAPPAPQPPREFPHPQPKAASHPEAVHGSAVNHALKASGFDHPVELGPQPRR